jgi:hypothetical protein
MINKKPVQHALNGLINLASPLAALVSDKFLSWRPQAESNRRELYPIAKYPARRTTSRPSFCFNHAASAKEKPAALAGNGFTFQ